MTYLGDWNTGATVPLFFTTHAQTGAAVAPSSAFEAADIILYKDGSATQRTSQAGWTITSPFDSLTGLHCITFDTSDNTDSGFYAAGSTYTAVLSPDETVDGLAVIKVLGSFSIERYPKVDVGKWLGTTPATPTVAGVPEVDVTHLLGTGWLTPGTAGTPDVNVKLISDDATAANNLELAYDGTGYRQQYVARHVSKAGVTTYYQQGSDTDAARGTALLAAQTAASDGCIYVDYPLDINVNAQLGKAGVDFSFCAGSYVYIQDEILWADFDVGTGTPFQMGNVFGHGRFNVTGTANDVATVLLFNPTGTVHFEANEITSTSTGRVPAIQVSGGQHVFRVHTRVRSDYYDGLWLDEGYSDTISIDLETPILHGGDNGFEWSRTGTDVDAGEGLSNVRIKAGTISGQERSGGAPSAVLVNTGAIGHAHIECDKIIPLEIAGGDLIESTTIPAVKFASSTADTLILKCGLAKGQVWVGTGTYSLEDCVVDTAHQALPSIRTQTNGLTLRNVRCITNGSETNSIYAASAQTVNVSGSLNYNKALSNITLQSVSADVVNINMAALSAEQALTAAENASAFASNAATQTTAANLRLAVGLATASLDTQFAALPTAGENADAVWDELKAGHAIANSYGAYVDQAISDVSGGGTSGPVEHTPIARSRILQVKDRGDGTYGVVGGVCMIPGETLWWAVELKGSQLAPGELIDSVVAPTITGAQAANLTTPDYGILATLVKFKAVLSGSALTTDTIGIQLTITSAGSPDLIIDVPVTVGP